MPDRKITQFPDFEGTADSSLFFVVASGDSNNPLSKNYRFPFDKLASDVIGANSPWKLGSDSIYTLTGLVGMGTASPAYQLDVAGTISGYSGKFKEGIFSEGLTISGVSVATGEGKWLDASAGDIYYDGGDVGIGNSLFYGGGALSVGQIGWSAGITLHESAGGLRANLVLDPVTVTETAAKLQLYSGGNMQTVISSYDTSYFYGAGAADRGHGTVAIGPPPGYPSSAQLYVTGGDGRILAPSGDFTKSLTISGVSVTTGEHDGKWSDGSFAGSIYYDPPGAGPYVGIGTDPQYLLDIQQDSTATNGLLIRGIGSSSASLMINGQDDFAQLTLRSGSNANIRLTTDGAYSSHIQGDLLIGSYSTQAQAKLHITGGDGRILAPSGDFTKSLTVSGVSVATGAGGKWSDGASAGDIYYDGGPVNIGMDGGAGALNIVADRSWYGIGQVATVIYNAAGAFRSALYLDNGDNAVLNLLNNAFVEGVHLSASGTSNFQGPLTISGNPVSTGAGGGAGKWIDDPAYALGITYEDGPVAISGDLRVSGSGYFSANTLLVGEDISLKAADDYLMISGSGIKVGDPGSEGIVLTTEKLGLGTAAVLESEPGDINFKLLTDQNRFVIGTTGQPGGDLSGWYRFNDYTIKGASDMGAHIMNPVDSRVYTEGSSFMLLTEDSAGTAIGYIARGSGSLSANNQISIGISAKLDETETPRDLEFTDADGEVYSIINGDSDTLGVNSLPLSQGLQAPSMGANAVTLLIDGGYF
jgi:hypothetical protein